MTQTSPQGHEFALKLGSVKAEVRVTRFSILEGLSSISKAQVELVSQTPDLAFDEVIDQNAKLIIRDRNNVERVFEGLVSGFAQGDTGEHWTAYRAIIEPPLHRLQYRSDSRIFQQTSVQDILAQVLNDAGVNQHHFSLAGALPVREYCVQYRESDYDFFARLCAEEGLVFYHSFDTGAPVLEISNSVAYVEAAPGLKGAVTYSSTGGGIDPEEPAFIQRFEYQENLRAGNLAQRDYWFKKPLYFWDKEAWSNDGPLYGKKATSGSDLYHYDAYSRGHHEGDDKTASRYVKYRLEAHRKDGAIGQGRSTVACLIPGFHFKMQGFGRDPAMARMGVASTHKLNQAYLVTQITHEGEQPQSLDQDAPESSSRYHNRFEVIPEGIEWRAHHYFHGDAPRKPRVDGPQLARVVGPKGEEIFCDDYGRVKLQFPWDRHGKGDESSSCWVRVSQLWAGTKYGGMAIPRIGQEVIVEFLDGDIDQPIITGRTYNAHNLPPYELPVNKTVTTWKSDTHKGRGSNELRFEDEDGKEEVYLHAQKDFVSQVNGFSTKIVGGISTVITQTASMETSIGPKSIHSPTSISLSTGVNTAAAIPLLKPHMSSQQAQTLAILNSVQTNSDKAPGSVNLFSVGPTNINSSKDMTISTSKELEVSAKSQSVYISSNSDNLISGAYKLDSGGKMVLNSGMMIYQNGSSGITLKSGQSSITLLPDGTIDLKGKIINLDAQDMICQKSAKIKLN